jgi:hypothetical protein
MSSARSVTISSSDGSVRDRIDDVDVPGDATRLVLRDGDGREHHFGRHSQREMFAHVATYLPDGSRDEYFRIGSCKRRSTSPLTSSMSRSSDRASLRWRGMRLRT